MKYLYQISASMIAVTLFILLSQNNHLSAQTTTIAGPSGSIKFGAVTVLTNGNYVVTDPSWANGSIAAVGAVYLYDGSTNALISTLTGSTANDKVGSSGILPLSNGNFVVRSGNWTNGSAAQAGAVTWVNGTTGLSGAVSTANSLVGSNTGDLVGSGATALANNGNYVIYSMSWANGSATAAGAVTWGNGTTGITATVSAAN